MKNHKDINSSRFSSMFAWLLAAALLATTSRADAQAVLVSDQEDYAPGETAILFGAGFWSGELIDLSIAIDDPVSGGHIGDYDWVSFTADVSGGFIAYYEVPQIAAGMVLTATAMGLDSGLIATATFTDNHFTLNAYSISAVGNDVTVSATIGGGLPLPTAVNAIVDPGGVSYALTRTTAAGVSPSTWSATFTGLCETTYTLRHIHAQITGHPGGGGNFNNVPAPNTATTGDCDPPPPCPTNAAPTLTASDLDLGSVTGCLNNGSFEYVANIAAADFNPVTGDPDGDPVIVTLNVSQVILVGPGLACATVTLTATDDPSARNVDGCPTLIALSTSVDVDVCAQVTYAFEGFLPPLRNDAATKVKRGSTVPVKFRLFDCSGNAICTDLGVGPHTIDVLYHSGAAPSGDPSVDDAGSSGDDGIDFRFSGECDSDGLWIFNLKTNSSYEANNTYKIRATLNDGTTHDVLISIKP